MEIKKKIQDLTMNSIRFKLVLAVIIVQILSTNIGQIVNATFTGGKVK